MGIDAELMQMVKKLARGGAKTAAHSLRTIGLIPLGPCDLVVSSATSNLYTLSVPNSSTTGESGDSGKLRRKGATKELVGNVELKNELKRLACSIGSDA